ncbi:MAG: pyridoxamine 5'-phosphate oxidase family protein [Acetanaerobacterium sp.]
MNTYQSATELMKQQFGHDVVVSLATCTENGVNVRTVNGYYKDGSFYVTTNMSTSKAKEIAKKSAVAICKDLMCAQGIGENIGSPKAEYNKMLATELKKVFAAFYDLHVNEDDPGTCILKIALTSAVVFNSTTKFAVDFEHQTAAATPFINDIVY